MQINKIVKKNSTLGLFFIRQLCLPKMKEYLENKASVLRISYLHGNLFACIANYPSRDQLPFNLWTSIHLCCCLPLF
jgi:hypothetical protein